ncbi:MAG: hypothetical protein QF463_15605 [Vicinamibacterales bacterium]|nr:hypothetical protein [Acidobacteriota bacterium]MDP6373097.1 hypothetical protein [Vicinamibacterales bacterium]MDP6610489.1 hypothetical protein [Vicinamibacterales bacterium]HAK55283.1 hypothetical protein [Acidobacteriota bacterium]
MPTHPDRLPLSPSVGSVPLVVACTAFAFALAVGQTDVGAQQPQEPGEPAASQVAVQEDEAAASGFALPDSDKLRIRLSFMAGYIHDAAVATLGFEKQGRLGYAIIGLFGDLSERVSYLIEINPVNETRPLPACGEEGFFYPNTPQAIGPVVECEPDGRLRVDDYRFVALDPVSQQGPIRQAHVQYGGDRLGLTFGRFMLPIGFDWEAMGSFSAKDATHIQRINAESNFGLGLDYTLTDWATVSGAAFLGDGNKFRDYDYFYFQDGSFDSNSALTTLVSGRIEPLEGLDVRATWKKGFTGSKVERLPNFYASKRHDDAVVISAQYRVNEYARVFGEYARYTWGLTETSAELLGLDTGPLDKPGYYVGADLSAPLTSNMRVGTVFTREELSRDDSLIALLDLEGSEVRLGRKERSTAVRVYADFRNAVTVALTYNDHSNPYRWVSGIEPIAGPNPEASISGSNKWGLIVRFRLQ